MRKLNFPTAAICGLSMWVASTADIARCDDTPNTDLLRHAQHEVGDFPDPKDKNFTDNLRATKALQEENKRDAAEGLESAGLRRLKKGNFVSAIDMLTAAASSQPDNVSYRKALCDAHVKYGHYLKENKEQEKAIQEYRTALSLDDACQEARERLKEFGGADPSH